MKSFSFACILALTGVVSAVDDLCTPGSDAECARYGKSMCCAHIQYDYLGDKQDFYACASKPGIEFTNGMIRDESGFVGSWYCAFATQTQATLLATVALASLMYF